MRAAWFIIASISLALSGCATTSSDGPPKWAIELSPGEEHEILMPGRYAFRFSLDEPAEVVLESQTFPGYGYIRPNGQLKDAQGQVVAQDWHSGRMSNFRIERELTAGTWYLEVDDPFACRGILRCEDRDYRYTVSLEVVPSSR
ncbi:hypothetical protein [Litchfieldella xinjiangensis]|uniref:hypothetical protein n=1 Tax=Litchfieldella xinjiangensis TaxID=1166948 RepID=UPI0005B7B071|nr:hypothetical protein [Halomonas xinjiangensis]